MYRDVAVFGFDDMDYLPVLYSTIFDVSFVYQKNRDVASFFVACDQRITFAKLKT